MNRGQAGRFQRAIGAVAAAWLSLQSGCVNDYELWLGGVRPSDAACEAGRCEDASDAAAIRDAAPRDAASSDAELPSCSADDDCRTLPGGFCDSASGHCAQCHSNSDCQEALRTPHCNPDTLRCEGCIADDECSDDTRCVQRACEPR